MTEPTYKLLDGKKLADEIKSEIAEEVKALTADGRRAPHLAAILVGNDGGSLTYVGHKVKACEQVGFRSTLLHFTDTAITEEYLLSEVKKLNEDKEVDGFIVQLSRGLPNSRKGRVDRSDQSRQVGLLNLVSTDKACGDFHRALDDCFVHWMP